MQSQKSSASNRINRAIQVINPSEQLAIQVMVRSLQIDPSKQAISQSDQSKNCQSKRFVDPSNQSSRAINRQSEFSIQVINQGSNRSIKAIKCLASQQCKRSINRSNTSTGPSKQSSKRSMVARTRRYEYIGHLLP